MTGFERIYTVPYPSSNGYRFEPQLTCNIRLCHIHPLGLSLIACLGYLIKENAISYSNISYVGDCDKHIKLLDTYSRVIKQHDPFPPSPYGTHSKKYTPKNSII